MPSETEIDEAIKLIEQISISEEREADPIDKKEHQALIEDRIKSETEHQRSTTELREKYADRAWRCLLIYSGVSGVLIVMSGFRLCGFYLPDQTLSILVSSPLVGAFSFIVILGRGLFSNR